MAKLLLAWHWNGDVYGILFIGIRRHDLSGRGGVSFLSDGILCSIESFRLDYWQLFCAVPGILDTVCRSVCSTGIVKMKLLLKQDNAKQKLNVC